MMIRGDYAVASEAWRNGSTHATSRVPMEKSVLAMKELTIRFSPSEGI